MSNTTDLRGFDEEYYNVTQSALGTIADHAAADAFHALKVDITPAFESAPRDDSSKSRSYHDATEKARGPHPFAVEMYLTPSGTPGTAADVAPIINSILLGTAVAGVTAASSSTTGCVTADDGVISIGDVLCIPNPTTGEPDQVVHVTNVVTADGNDTITWEPTLPFSPSATVAIPASIQYTLRDAVDSTKHFSIYKYSATGVQILTGCQATKISFSEDREWAKLNIDGSGAHYIQAGETTVKTTLSDSALVLIVDDPEQFIGLSTTNYVYLQIEDEIVKATAMDQATDTLTIVRGQKSTTPAQHLATTAITVWKPSSQTTAGEPVAGTLGSAYIDNTAMEYTSISASTDEKFKPVEPAGSVELTRWIAPSTREVSAEITLTGRGRDLAQVGKAALVSSVEMLAQMGDDSGAMVGLYLPAIQWEPAGLPSNTNDVTALALKSKAVFASSATTNDDLRIAFL